MDILLHVDDVLFLVEAKAGGFTEPASRGAPMSLEQELRDLIIKGHRQSERVERYIRSSEEVVFYDETGRIERHRLRHSRFRLIFRIVVTREDLGWVGARIACLSGLDPGFSNSYPWHVSIDDLRIVSDLFRNDGVRFAHYLEQRLRASAESGLVQHDEIEHIGLYNKLNSYHQKPVEDVDWFSYDTSYMLDIDHYFMEKSSGGSPTVPTQDMPTKMRRFVNVLRDSGLKGRFEVGSIVLSMDQEGRGEFQTALDTLDKAMSEGKQRAFRMPFTSLHLGLTVTCASGWYWEAELQNSAVQMEQGRCDRWLVVQLKNRQAYRVTKIEVILPGRFSDEELSTAKARHEERTHRVIASEKPSRNDQCPCGSGKKYKKCHGFRL